MRVTAIHLTNQVIYLRQEEELSSSTVNQILGFGDDGELFPEMLRTSEVSSCSGCGVGGSGCGGEEGDICCYDEASLSSPFSSLPSMDPSALAALLDAPDPEPPIATNYPPVIPWLLSSSNDRLNPICLTDTILNGTAMPCANDHLAIPPITVTTSQLLSQIHQPLPPPPPLLFKDDCPTLPGMDYIGLDPASTSCSFVNPTGMGMGMGMYFPGSLGMPIPGEHIFTGNLLTGAEATVPMPELTDYHSDCGGLGFFASEATSHQMAYGSSDMQVFDNVPHPNRG